jgi:hypothetical protein
VTGEAAATATKTCYAARIFGNDTNHRAAINLDASTLLTNEASPATSLDWTARKLYVGATEMLHWNATTDTAGGRAPYMLASRGLKFSQQPARYEDSRNTLHYTTYAAKGTKLVVRSDFGWPWTLARMSGVNAEHHAGYFKTAGVADTNPTYDDMSYSAEAFMGHNRLLTAGGNEVRSLTAAVTFDTATTTVILGRGQMSSSSARRTEAIRATTGNAAFVVHKSDTNADVLISGNDTGTTYGLRSVEKPI